MDLSVVLFLLTLLTGITWLVDRLVFARRRREAGITHRSWLLEYSAGLFPVFIVVFLLRSFLVEPFRIPSGSMIPTLLVGDMILVNKYSYGVRLPVVNTKVLDVGEPKVGDVAVFRYPIDPSINYVKRVVGTPGDRIEYRDARLTVNGKPMPLEPVGEYQPPGPELSQPTYSEDLGGVRHNILTNIRNPHSINFEADAVHPEACQPAAEGFTCTVPEGHYFMMGDNRENSSDSRRWGFVPEQNLVGRAFFIFMNLGDLKRIGSFK